jgi:copper chaperone CopZ
VEKTLRIEGMSCGHCVARVKKTLEAVPALTVVDVSIGSARVETGAAEPSGAIDAAIRALDTAGYPATVTG